MITHQPTNSLGNYNYNAFIYTDTRYYAHFHANYELIYVYRGSVPCLIGGSERVLTEGELVLISPYTVHGFSVEGEARAWVGVFSEDHIPAFAAAHSGTQFAPFRSDAHTEQLLCRHLFLEEVPPLYLRIALLYAACHACIERAEPQLVRSDRRLMIEIVDRISSCSSGDLTMSELARQMGYEYHYFSTVFHQCFGMDFKKLLNVFRVNQACKLLLQDDRDVTEIYRECGFTGIRNFNRVFQRHLGCTPSEYRKGQRKAT